MRAFLGLWALALALSLCGLPNAHASPGETHVVSADSTELRATPDFDAEIVRTLDAARRVKELRRRGAWIKVLVFGEIGLEGWILEAALEPETAPEDGGDLVPEQQTPARDDGRKALPARFILEISGRQQRFRAGCTIIGAGGDSRTWRYEGRAPSRLRLDGREVRCRVDRLDQHAGSLGVTLHERGAQLPVARNRTQSAFGCVRLRSDGPWGGAYARRCSRIAIFRTGQTTGAP
jgi:hypothetical protein